MAEIEIMGTGGSSNRHIAATNVAVPGGAAMSLR
jgi:hypothetical protein